MLSARFKTAKAGRESVALGASTLMMLLSIFNTVVAAEMLQGMS